MRGRSLIFLSHQCTRVFLRFSSVSRFLCTSTVVEYPVTRTETSPETEGSDTWDPSTWFRLLSFFTPLFFFRLTGLPPILVSRSNHHTAILLFRPPLPLPCSLPVTPYPTPTRWGGFESRQFYFPGTQTTLVRKGERTERGVTRVDSGQWFGSPRLNVSQIHTLFPGVSVGAPR